MGIFDDIEAYSPVTGGSISQNYQDSVQNQADRASRPTSSFQQESNQNVAEKSNLMGPKNEQDPESAALSSRANQIYGSAVNNMTRNSEVNAVNRQTRLQGQSMDNYAAIFSNAQSRAQITYQQVAYQREAALNQEINKRNLFSSIFGGVAGVGGAVAANVMHNARQSSPIETAMNNSMDSMMSDTSDFIGNEINRMG